MVGTVYKKMKLKQGTSGAFLYAPEEYIIMTNEQDYIDFSEHDKFDFVHLFIQSINDYNERIAETLSKLSETGVLWISYPKADKNSKYDVNRDILFALTQKDGIIACSSAALDEKWSALRFKRI